MSKTLKLLFMGSSSFAIPSLIALIEARHDVVLAMTQPDRPSGRGQGIRRCPLAKAALEYHIPLYQPEKIKDGEAAERIRELSPDAIIVVAYGRILPPDILTIPKLGAINLHASLLPKYRGAAPINWAIINGESQTGVTTQMICEELDAGDILLQASTAIDEIETAGALYDRLAPLGAELLMKTVQALANGTLKPKPQDHAQASYAPILKKEDGHIDWKHPAQEIFNRIRGLSPWPGSFAKMDGKTLRIHEAGVANLDHHEAPGTIIESGKNLAVACGAGALYLLEVQLEGKKRMGTSDFLRGHPMIKGALLE